MQTGEGWLVGNALSALAYEAEKLYIQMDYICKQNHADTADLDELVKIARDRGIYRKTATNAEVLVEAHCTVPIGSRFYLKSFHYAVTETMKVSSSMEPYAKKLEQGRMDLQEN